MNVPVIRLEIQGMKQTMHMMLSEYTLQLDEMLQSALKEALTPGNLDAYVKREADQAIKAAVSDEIREFFRYSRPGREAVREAVQKWLADSLAAEASRDGD